MNKALLRLKKKQQKDKEKTEPTSKISNLAKQLEGVLQGRASCGEKKVNFEADIVQNEDITKLIENKTTSPMIKKKKSKKIFTDNE